jgi:hypothetical protein
MGLDKSFPKHTITLRLPTNCLPEEEQYYSMNLEGEVRACYILRLANVWANRELALWTTNGEMITESFAYPWIKDRLYGSLKNKAKFKIKNVLRKKQVVRDKVVWCLDGFSTGGYYHWITEILPRLWMVKEELPGMYFAIPDYFFDKWPFSKEFFALLGVKNFLVIENQRKYLIESLILPTRPGDPFYRQHIPLANGVRWLQQSANKVSSQKFGKRIFISRGKAGYRKIVNEEELIPVLKKYEFDILYFEELSLSEQISVCENAEVLMGLHGAGLTNLVFLPSGSKVIEIRPSNTYHMYNCFFTLSHHFDCEYNFVLCNYAPSTLPTEKRIDDHSVIVDPKQVDEKLKLILEIVV